MFQRLLLSLLLAGAPLFSASLALAQVGPPANQRISEELIINGQQVPGVMVTQNGVVQTYTCPSPQPYVTANGTSSGWACFDQATGTWIMNAQPPQQTETLPQEQTATVYTEPSTVYSYEPYPYYPYYPYYPWGYSPFFWGGPFFGFGFGNGHGHFDHGHFGHGFAGHGFAGHGFAGRGVAPHGFAHGPVVHGPVGHGGSFGHGFVGPGAMGHGSFGHMGGGHMGGMGGGHMGGMGGHMGGMGGGGHR
jgi:hypothetical protein